MIGSRMRLGKLAVTNAVCKKARGSVIILHGSCDSGSGMKAWLNKIMETEFKFFEFRILYPTAPVRPYTLLNGQNAGIWFDRICLGPQLPEDSLTIESSASELKRLIDAESTKSGIPLSQMVVGGFSTGGKLAGVFAFSSFLSQDSIVYQTLKHTKLKENSWTSNNIDSKFTNSEVSSPTCPTVTLVDTQVVHSHYPTLSNNLGEDNQKLKNVKTKLPPLFMSQGSKDPLARLKWAKNTFSRLRDHGVEGHFFTHPKTGHAIDKTQLTILHRWIHQVLAEA